MRRQVRRGGTASPDVLSKKGLQTIDQLSFSFGDRAYRVRGLSSNTTVERLRINLLVQRKSAIHVDVLDLYNSRQRQAFVRAAASELEVGAELVKRDLGKLLLELEKIQEARLVSAQTTCEDHARIPASEEAEALELLQAPTLLDRTLDDLEATGLVGERLNAMAAFLAVCSRKLHDPLAVVVQSSSSAGKSTLMDAVLNFVPPEDRVKYSAMTSQAVYYLGKTDLRHKVLALVEEEGARRASYALKLLQSERELVLATTGKAKDGRLSTQTYRVEGPVMLFLTTTAVDISDELMNRAIVLTVDEDVAQTRAIHESQRRRERLAGLEADAERSRLVQLHRNAQRLLRPLRVLNPFAESLSFTDVKTRTRRDHAKYLTLIRAIALLHQHQRKIKTTTVAGATIEYVEVRPMDIERANVLMKALLSRALDDLAPQTRRLLQGLEQLVEARGRQDELPPHDVRFTRRQAREFTAMTYEQVRLHLGRLVDMEYVVVERALVGRAYRYRLPHLGISRRASGGDSPMKTTNPVSLGIQDPKVHGTTISNETEEMDGKAVGVRRLRKGARK